MIISKLFWYRTVYLSYYTVYCDVNGESVRLCIRTDHCVYWSRPRLRYCRGKCLVHTMTQYIRDTFTRSTEHRWIKQRGALGSCIYSMLRSSGRALNTPIYCTYREKELSQRIEEPVNQCKHWCKGNSSSTFFRVNTNLSNLHRYKFIDRFPLITLY